MEKNLEFVNVEELKPEGKLIKKIGFKSKFSEVLFFIIGAALCFTFNTYAIILGLFLISIALAVFVLVKDYKTLDIYEKGVVVYDTKDVTKGLYIPYDDLQEWTGKYSEYGSPEAIMFKLKSGQQIYKNTFLANTAFLRLNKLIGEKESKAIAAEKRRNQPLTHPIIEKLKNKLMRKDK